MIWIILILRFYEVKKTSGNVEPSFGPTSVLVENLPHSTR